MANIRGKAEHQPGTGVLVIVPWLEGGGGQGALLGILKHLGESADIVVLFSNNKNYSDVMTLARNFRMLDNPRTVAGVIKAGLEARAAVKPYRTVYSLMRGSHVALGLFSGRILKNKRFAASFHQLPSTDRNGLRSKMENLLVRRALRGAKLVTAPSERAIAEIEQFRLCDRDILAFQANTVRSRQLPPVTPRKGNLESLRLLSVGRLMKQKGLDLIPELLATVRVPVSWRVAGEGPERSVIQTAFDAHATTNGVEHSLTFLGQSSDVESHLDWCDALLMPSRWELSPLTVWEAWAAGRPVIASDLLVFKDLQRYGPVTQYASSTFRATVEGTLLDEAARMRSFSCGINAVAVVEEQGPLGDFLAG